MNINTSVVFCQSFVSSCCVHFDLWQGILAIGSLASSLAGFLVGSLAGFLTGFLAGSLANSSVSSLAGSSVGSGCRYGFTAIVLKLVGLLGNYTLYISPLILNNLNGLIYLLLCLILPFCHISMSKLRGRLQIIVINRPFYWFSVLLTYFLALILVISSIAFFMAAACYIIDSTSKLSLLI